MKPTYEDFIWWIQLGIELGILDKKELKLSITISDCNPEPQ